MTLTYVGTVAVVIALMGTIGVLCGKINLGK